MTRPRGAGPVRGAVAAGQAFATSLMSRSLACVRRPRTEAPMLRASRSLFPLAALAALLVGSARADPAPLPADDAALAALALALAAVPSPDPAGLLPAAAVPSPRVELVTTVTARSVAFDELHPR